MVADGIYYGLGLSAAGGVIWFLIGPWFALPLFLLAAFCLYFFRDPNRDVPPGDVVVSPADGKIVAVKPISTDKTRISIFLNVFDVHVNRSPIEGTIQEVSYHKGSFLVASKEDASAQNEQNIVTVAGEGTTVVFSQIAGLIARRIVFKKRVGERVAAGERVGMIKFGSRVDVVLGQEWQITAAPGHRVVAGSSILAVRK